MSDKEEQNLTDSMKQRGERQKEKKQNVTNKRKSREEDDVEEPLSPKRHRGGDSCSDSTGSTSSSYSAGDPASEDASSAGSYVLDPSMLEMNREAQSLARHDSPGGANSGLSGRCLSVPSLSVAGISGAGPLTKAKQKIWYREATSTTSCSPEKDAAMDFEDE